MARDYKREYATYQSTDDQKKKRALRNKARRQAIRDGKASKGDGTDVHHVTAISKGGANGRTKVVPASENRSFDRDSKRALISEISSRERKKK
jgi:hypothetical protein